MSFKGFGKAITRAPQQFKYKMNKGYQTQDPVYEDSERRFKEIETETKKLNETSKKYSKAVNDMLNHQIGFSKGIEEIFKPVSGKMSDPNSTVPEDNPEGIDACIAYREIVSELQRTLKPDLDLIELKVVRPAQELLKVVNSIRKMLVKRQHKKMDLDRHMNTLQKYEVKTSSLDVKAKDEEKLYKSQNEVEMAQQEFDYYNDLLKEQLPVLFELQNEFLKPMFVSFYYMQLNIFYTLYNKFQDMKIPYFDLEGDILETFQYKRGNIEEQTDSLSICNFKLGYSKAKLEMTRKRFQKDGAGIGIGSDGQSSYGSTSPPPTSSTLDGGNTSFGSAPMYNSYQQSSQYPPEKQVYQPQAQPSYGGAAVSSGTTDASAPPPSYNAPTNVEYCTALYDYQAQQPGDLTIKQGDRIEVVDRTTDPSGWWLGRVNGVEGNFPANYVSL
ncbi:hypothetical protein ACO0SA_004514 [Hanseniaspora valbyensis]